MSFELVKHHIESLKNETELLSKLLQEKLPKSDGRARLAIPQINLDDQEKQFITSTFQYLGPKITEIHIVFSKVSPNLLHAIDDLVNKYLKLQSTALAIQQGITYGDNTVLFEPLNLFHNSLLNLERVVINADSLTPKSSKIKTYSDAEMNSIFKETEKQRRISRREFYFKVDSDADELLGELTNPQNDEVLDNATAKLLHLMGFDTQVYGRRLRGDVDVLGISIADKVLVIIDTTTASISKVKVDQIFGRKSDYEGFSSKLTDSSLSVYPLVITSNEKPLADELAQREAMVNKVGVLTRKELKELVDLVKKGKINPPNFIEYIKKKIPVT